MNDLEDLKTLALAMLRLATLEAVKEEASLNKKPDISKLVEDLMASAKDTKLFEAIKKETGLDEERIHVLILGIHQEEYEKLVG